ncbi:MAG: signal peptidase II [bacterium]|nr:signal peptidase II [bacterium]
METEQPTPSAPPAPQEGYRAWIVLFVVIGLVLAVDQGAKRLVLAQMAYGETVQPIAALVPYLQITLTENRGAAFGFLPQGGDIFLVIAFVVVAVMLVLYPRLGANAWASRIAVGMVCGGALGNALDRLQYGAVVDFVHLQIPGLVSNVSNFADHAIVIGVFILVVQSWRTDGQQKRNLNAAEVE